MNYMAGKEEKRRVIHRIKQNYDVEVQDYERISLEQLKQMEECLCNVYHDFSLKGWLPLIRIKGRNPNEEPWGKWNRCYGQTVASAWNNIRILISMDAAADDPALFQRVVYHELIHAVCARMQFAALGMDREDGVQNIIGSLMLGSKSHVCFSTVLADRFSRQFNGKDYIDLMKGKGMKKYFSEKVSTYAVNGDKYAGAPHAKWSEELIADAAARHYTGERNEVTEQIFNTLLWADQNLDAMQKQAEEGLVKIMHEYHMNAKELKKKYHLPDAANIHRVPLQILTDMYPQCRAYACRNRADVDCYREGYQLPWRVPMTDYKAERYDFCCEVMKLYQKIILSGSPAQSA